MSGTMSGESLGDPLWGESAFRARLIGSVIEFVSDLLQLHFEKQLPGRFQTFSG